MLVDKYQGFRRKALWLGLLVLLGGCASVPKVERLEGASEAEEKSVAWGVFLAAVPGFFVHGLGSSYAGDALGAEDLLAQEIVAVYFGLSIGFGYAVEATWKEWIRDEVDAGVADVVDDVFLWQSRTTGPLTMAAGGYFFLSSWIADIARTPGLIEAHNRRLATGWIRRSKAVDEEP